MSATRRVVKFLLLPWKEKRIFCRAFFLCNRYRRQLKKQLFQTLWLEARADVAKAKLSSSSAVPPLRLAWLIEKAAQTILRNSCLARAFTGYLLFAENGWNPRLHIGAFKDAQGEFSAHAWLSVNDQIVLGDLPDLDAYQEFTLNKDEHAEERISSRSF